jgi:hypothetical protein
MKKGDFKRLSQEARAAGITTMAEFVKFARNASK